MIPVFLCSVISRFDLLDRLLDSVDVPVGRSLIIDNARSGYQRPGWCVWSPPYGSMGLPGSLNFGITQTPDAPWWFWSSNDVWFEPGTLAVIADLMQTDQPRLVTYRFAYAAVNRAVLDLVGLFDEWSFWPLYYDDDDFLHRCLMAGVEVISFDGGFHEGADGFETSMTTNSDPILMQRSLESALINRNAYIDKWGGHPGNERYRTPWGKRIPLWTVKPDLQGRVDRTWDKE